MVSPHGCWAEKRQAAQTKISGLETKPLWQSTSSRQRRGQQCPEMAKGPGRRPQRRPIPSISNWIRVPRKIANITSKLWDEGEMLLLTGGPWQQQKPGPLARSRPKQWRNPSETAGSQLHSEEKGSKNWRGQETTVTLILGMDMKRQGQPPRDWAAAWCQTNLTRQFSQRRPRTFGRWSLWVALLHDVDDSVFSNSTLTSAYFSGSKRRASVEMGSPCGSMWWHGARPACLDRAKNRRWQFQEILLKLPDMPEKS